MKRPEKKNKGEKGHGGNKEEAAGSRIERGGSGGGGGGGDGSGGNGGKCWEWWQRRQEAARTGGREKHPVQSASVAAAVVFGAGLFVGDAVAGSVAAEGGASSRKPPNENLVAGKSGRLSGGAAPRR